MATQEAAKRIGQQAYGILLILTDGAVSDINGTKEAIIAASDAPLSIVIVGIGHADFSAMQFLDDFQSQEAGRGRDICQFVEFSRHASNKMALTQATLDEIPDQLVEYFTSRCIKPLSAITGSRVNVLANEHNEEEDIDLNLEFSAEGEINLADYNEGLYDDTGYGDFSTYAGLTVLPPPTNPDSNGRAQPFFTSAPVAASPVFHVQVSVQANPMTVSML
jgi:Copine